MTGNDHHRANRLSHFRERMCFLVRQKLDHLPGELVGPRLASLRSGALAPTLRTVAEVGAEACERRVVRGWNAPVELLKAFLRYGGFNTVSRVRGRPASSCAGFEAAQGAEISGHDKCQVPSHAPGAVSPQFRPGSMQIVPE